MVSSQRLSLLHAGRRLSKLVLLSPEVERGELYSDLGLLSLSLPLEADPPQIERAFGGQRGEDAGGRGEHRRLPEAARIGQGFLPKGGDRLYLGVDLEAWEERGEQGFVCAQFWQRREEEIVPVRLGFER